jgi:hypothetical protein
MIIPSDSGNAADSLIASEFLAKVIVVRGKWLSLSLSAIASVHTNRKLTNHEAWYPLSGLFLILGFNVYSVILSSLPERQQLSATLHLEDAHTQLLGHELAEL